MFLMNVLHTSVAFIFAFLLYLHEDIRNQENKGGKQTPKLVLGHESCMPPGKVPIPCTVHDREVPDKVKGHKPFILRMIL